ncbi:MAG: TRC40/GET3/ArsA family transport-energizing ATPase [Candidatus Lernaella stagnicola]|nr:TRC40/GET3/ArsA family transport-energizing ATPase [Candidatus Lernaella stagnicola]
MRVILYTGKGGVGKTTISAATAYGCALRGKRTIVISTDAAHSLADLFDREIGPEPTEIRENLYACEVEVHHELAKNWGTIQAYIKHFLSSRGYGEVLADELSVVPGMEDLFSLLRLLEMEESGEYDVAVIDCAPTGATLQLLGFTDVFDWYMNRFFDIERRLVRAIRPVAERIIQAPLPGDDVFGQVEDLYAKMMAIKTMLTDPTRASVRLVVNPERMVIAESRRAHTCLGLYGYPLDAVIVNRVLPADVDGYLAEWVGIQKHHMQTIDASFHPLPRLQCKLFPREMTGLPAVGVLADEVFGDRDPAEIMYQHKPFELEAKQDYYEMRLYLPGVTKKDVSLLVKDGELILGAAGFKRHILLPRQLDEHVVAKARLNGDIFTIIFAKDSA